MIAASIILIYVIGFFCALADLQLKRPVNAQTARTWLRQLATWLTALGFVLHGMLLISAFFNLPTGTGGAGDISGGLTKGYYLQLLSWIVVLLYFIFRQRADLRLLSLTSIPLALLLFGLSFKAAQVKSVLPPSLAKLFLHLHIGAFFFSFALLVMGFGAGLFFIYSENKIKRKKTAMMELSPELPALASCDKVNHLAVLMGFPLYTVGLVSGFVWAGPTWGQTISGDAKEIISIINWLLFAFLFHERIIRGVRGRKAALLLIGVFGVAVASLLSNFFIPGRHNFFQQ